MIWLVHQRPVRLLTLLALYLALLVVPSTAHAAESIRLDVSQPGHGEVIEESPETVRLRFNTDVAVDTSEFLVLNAAAEPIVTGQPRSGSNDRELVLPIGTRLSDGLYTVQWRVQSDSGDQRAASFFTFQVGNPAAALAAMPPEAVFEDGSAWVTVSGTWLQLLGTTLSVGIVIVWLLLVRPLVVDSRYGRWLRRLALLGIGIALTGIGAHIVAGISAGGAPLDLTMANGDGPGWILLLGHLMLLGALILTPALWRKKRLSRLGMLGVFVAAATLVPLAMSGSLSGEQFGYAAALTSQWLRLLAISLWLGGILVLGVLMYLQIHRERQDAFLQFVSRATTGAIVSTIILLLTSLYLADLTIGRSLSGIETDFGQRIVTAGIIGAIAVGFGGVALARVRRSSDRGKTEPGLRVILFLVPALIAAALFAEASVSSIPNAREQILASQERVTLDVDADTYQAAIHIAPGITGTNRITADIAGRDTPVSDSTQALIRVSQPGTLEGQRDILLSPLAVCTADGEVVETDVARFDSTAALLGAPGNWRFDLVIHDLELGAIEESFELSVSDQRHAGSIPPPPLRFSGLQSAIGIFTGALVIALGVDLYRVRGADQEQGPQKLALLALTVFTVLALWQGRISHTPEAHAWNPIPRTVESVEIGQAVFREHCIACHGEDGSGTGDLADSLDRRPSDLTDSHMDTHPAGDIAWWIREGIDPAMPGFANSLDEEEVWHLVNYLRSLRHPVDDEPDR